ncbi:hypothetical protein AB4876_13930 [Zhongshania guokunii]|uniref:Bor protein n=1 Tax=Zhongshania guokunii TaxID=641783 RepID=A0ABV3U9B1_9GAMM
MYLKRIAVFALLLASAGCTTIHFDNGTPNEAKIVTEQWHHNAILALVEVSDPVNLSEECGSSTWSSVETELSFLNAFASGFVNFVLPVWYPKTVEVSCN